MTTNSTPTTTPESWAAWLNTYTAEAFYRSFLLNCQGAESTCIHCGATISLDIVQGGGVPDWSNDGDYGCGSSPDTIDGGGVGGHAPRGTMLAAQEGY